MSSIFDHLPKSHVSKRFMALVILHPNYPEQKEVFTVYNKFTRKMDVPRKVLERHQKLDDDTLFLENLCHLLINEAGMVPSNCEWATDCDNESDNNLIETYDRSEKCRYAVVRAGKEYIDRLEWMNIDHYRLPRELQTVLQYLTDTEKYEDHIWSLFKYVKGYNESFNTRISKTSYINLHSILSACILVNDELESQFVSGIRSFEFNLAMLEFFFHSKTFSIEKDMIWFSVKDFNDGATKYLLQLQKNSYAKCALDLKYAINNITAENVLNVIRRDSKRHFTFSEDRKYFRRNKQN